MSLLTVALVLAQFSTPDGSHRVDINPNEITSIRDPRTFSAGHWAHGTGCLIVTTSGRFIPVHENCDMVRSAIGPGHPPGSGPCTLVCGGSIRP
jgi:hypothetical protein